MKTYAGNIRFGQRFRIEKPYEPDAENADELIGEWVATSDAWNHGNGATVSVEAYVPEFEEHGTYELTLSRAQEVEIER